MATGLSLSNTSNLSSTQRSMIAAAKVAFEPEAPDPDLIASTRLPQGHKDWTIGVYARLSDASALTEGGDLAQTQQLVTNIVTITPTEHGIIATPSKRLMRRQGDANIATMTGTLIARSLRRLFAKDIIALYDGLSKSVGGAGLVLDITHFRGSVAYLQTDNNAAYGPAQPPLVAPLHIEQISDIIADLVVGVPQGAARQAGSFMGLSAELLARWWRGQDRLHGVAIFHSGNIARDASDDAKGAILNREALHTVIANDAEPTEQPDNSLRVIEMGIFQEWSEAEIVDVHGAEIYTDAAATV